MHQLFVHFLFQVTIDKRAQMVYNTNRAQKVLEEVRYDMPVGEKLRELRGDKTQEEIAREVGVTKSSWAMYERN